MIPYDPHCTFLLSQWHLPCHLYPHHVTVSSHDECMTAQTVWQWFCIPSWYLVCPHDDCHWHSQRHSKTFTIILCDVHSILSDLQNDTMCPQNDCMLPHLSMCALKIPVLPSQSQFVCSQLLLCPPKDFVFPHNDLCYFKEILVMFTMTFYIHIMTCLLYFDYVLHSMTVWPSKWHDIISTLSNIHWFFVFSRLSMILYEYMRLHKYFVWPSQELCDAHNDMCILTITLYDFKMTLWTLILTFVPSQLPSAPSPYLCTLFRTTLCFFQKESVGP